MPVAGVHVVGIVNMTSDSFSDGGLYVDPDAAIAHARQLIADGADIIDLGPASSHPDSARVSPEEERQRLRPVLDALREEPVELSVDSCLPETQSFCAEAGVAYLNDIRGFPYPDVNRELAQSGCRFIVMHSIQRSDRATRETTDARAVIDGIYGFFEKRLEELADAGIALERCILDPGLGYFLGDTPEPSIRALRDIAHLKSAFGAPVLISASRKSFIGALTNRTTHERGAGTVAAELWAAEHGAEYIRTHDVRTLVDALRVWAALQNGSA